MTSHSGPGRVIGGVIRQALQDAEATGLLLLEPATPEGRLVIEWAGQAIGPDRVYQVPGDSGVIRSGDELEARERSRAAARVLAARNRLLLAHPANKTALLLGMDSPPEPLLPLGDLYASSVRRITGHCTLPDGIDRIAEDAGGIDVLDGALAAWVEDRHDLDDAISSLPPVAREAVRARLLRNRAARRWPRRVPKLGSRTLWIDLFA